MDDAHYFIHVRLLYFPSSIFILNSNDDALRLVSINSGLIFLSLTLFVAKVSEPDLCAIHLPPPPRPTTRNQCCTRNLADHLQPWPRAL